jgi:hypothetical protein
MASILLTVAGSVAGNAILPGIGGALLGSAGAMLGRTIDNALFGQSSIKGPRLDQLKVQDSSYGNGIPVIYGTARVSGNVIWASDLIETISTESAGGKGGGGAQIEKASYAVDCAIALGFGPVGAIRTIWADGKEVYGGGKWKGGVLWDAEIYLGSGAQEPSPLMESALGDGNVPAYRGVAYVVMHRLQLGNFGNRLPNFTFEVAGSEAPIEPKWLGVVNPGILVRPNQISSPQGLPPAVVARRGSRVARVVVGGAEEALGQYAFVAIEYDVTGEAPVEIERTPSGFTTLPGGADLLQELSWAVSPSGKRIVFQMQFGADQLIALAVYDIETRQFGNLFSGMLETNNLLTQIAWLDDQRLVLIDEVDDVKGVRVYAAAGLSIVSLGFFNIWGVNSVNRFPLPTANFVPCPGGLLCLASNDVSLYDTVYARGIAWQGNTLHLGAEQLLSSTVDETTTGFNRLLPIGSEWVLMRSYQGNIQLMSFISDFSNLSVTRDWVTLSFSPLGFAMPGSTGERLFFVHQGLSNSPYRYGEIDVTPTSFSIGLPPTLIAGSPVTLGTSFFAAYAIDATRFLLLNGTSGDVLNRVALFEKGRSAQALSIVASDLLERAGYEEEDYDAGDLEELMVEGYVISDPTAARAALEPLQGAYGFDLVESDGVLKARRYAAVSDAVIAQSETRAARHEEEVPPMRSVIRAQELDLPREVVVMHTDPALDYQKGSQRARRSAGVAHNVQNIVLPLVCSAIKAREVAESQLYRQWAEREQVSFTLSRAYAALDPGDVVTLDGKSLRLTDLRVGNGLIKAEALSIDAAALAAFAGNAESGQGTGLGGTVIVPSTLFLMDLPLLRNEDDQPGFYAGISGRDGWRGAGLFRSGDDASFLLSSRFSLPAVVGLAAGALGPASPYYMDRGAGVKVALIRGELSSCTELELLNGANAALLGDEVIQFQTAVLEDDGSYTLTNILRGRRGTESASDSHVAGERFVLLNAETARFLPLTLSDRGRVIYFRAPSTGEDVEEMLSTAFTPALRTIQPLSPVHVKASRNGGGDITFTWMRRARKYAEWVDLIDVPLDEEVERYDLEIFNGSNVVRSFSALTAPTGSYTAAQQITDFGSVQSSVSVGVYQLSSRYGRGRAALATL